MIISTDTYDFGSTVVLAANFTDTNNNPADPSSVTLRIMDPTGIETVHPQSDVNRTGPGAYNYGVIVLKAGVWFYRWEGTGLVSITDEQAFVVTSSPFPDAAA